MNKPQPTTDKNRAERENRNRQSQDLGERPQQSKPTTQDDDQKDDQKNYPNEIYEETLPPQPRLN